jgi:hypothetical protein
MKSINAMLAAAAFVSALMATPASAQVGKGLSGPHWNLNIIGVPKDKSASMDQSGRHTVFVPLDSGEDVGRKVKIYYERNLDDPNKFNVSDGNATDDDEATIQVPFEFCVDEASGCTELLSFDVYAVGLGKPGGAAIVTVDCTYSDDVVNDGGTAGLECEDTVLLGSIEIKRTNNGKNKPSRVDITNLFRVTGCLDQVEDGVCDAGDLKFKNLWIFNIQALQEYFWDYDNNGLKLLHIRFYATTSGCIGTVGGGGPIVPSIGAGGHTRSLC